MATTPRRKPCNRDTLGMLEPTLPVRELGSRQVGHRRGGRGPQRPDLRSLPGKIGPGRSWCSSRVSESAGRARSTSPGRATAISPCAYLVGLLHPLVIEELNMPAYGFRVVSRRRPDSSSRSRTAAASSSGMTTSGARTRFAGFSAVDVDGWRDFCRGQGATARRAAARRRRRPLGRQGAHARGDRRAARRRHRRPAICSSSGRWSNASRTTSRTSGSRWPTSARA